MAARPIRPLKRAHRCNANPGLPSANPQPGTSTAPQEAKGIPSFKWYPPQRDYNRENSREPENPLDVSSLTLTPKIIFDFGAGDSLSEPPNSFTATPSETMLRMRELEDQIRRLRQHGNTPKLSGLRKERNGLLPIESLPAELLTVIIRAAIQEEASPSLRLTQLYTVSSWWRDVITTTPSLWGHITYGCPSVPIALLRSANSLLDIRIKAQSKVDSSLEKFYGFFKLVGPHLQRWRSILFAAPETFVPRLEIYLAQFPPQLVALTLHIAGLTKPVELPAQASFRHLDLRWSWIRWDTLNASQLQHFTLRDLHNSDDLDMDQLLEALRSCSNLRTLHLEQVSVRTEAVGPSTPAVTLPHLQSMEIIHVSEPFAHTLLNIFRANALSTFSLELSNPRTESQSTFIGALLKDEAAAPLSVLRNAPSKPLIHITAQSVRAQSTLSVDQRIVKLGLHYSSVDRDLLSLCASLSSEVHLYLAAWGSDFALLDAIPNFTELTVVDGAMTREIATKYLSRTDDNGSYACSNLKVLRSENWWSPKGAQALIKARKSAGQELQVLWGRAKDK